MKLVETTTFTPASLPAYPLINGTSEPKDDPDPSYLAKSDSLNKLE